MGAVRARLLQILLKLVEGLVADPSWARLVGDHKANGALEIGSNAIGVTNVRPAYSFLGRGGFSIYYPWQDAICPKAQVSGLIA